MIVFIASRLNLNKYLPHVSIYLTVIKLRWTYAVVLTVTLLIDLSSG